MRPIASPPCSLQARPIASDASSAGSPHRLPWRPRTTDTIRINARCAARCDGSSDDCAFLAHSCSSRSSRSQSSSVRGASTTGGVRRNHARQPPTSVVDATSPLGEVLRNAAANSASITWASARRIASYAATISARCGSIWRVRIVCVILRKLMPRSSTLVPSGTEMSAVTRTRSSWTRSRCG